MQSIGLSIESPGSLSPSCWLKMHQAGLSAAQPDVTVTLDTLHLVFSAFGIVQKIATFEKGQGFQALVQYSDAETAEQVRPNFNLR